MEVYSLFVAQPVLGLLFHEAPVPEMLHRHVVNRSGALLLETTLNFPTIFLVVSTSVLDPSAQGNIYFGHQPCGYERIPALTLRYFLALNL